MSESFEQLREVYKHPSDVKKIDGWEDTLKVSNHKKSLTKDFIIKELLKDFDQKIAYINGTLAEDRSLSESERQYLFAKRDAFRSFIKFFAGGDADIEDVNGKVDKSLKHAK